MTPTSPVRYQRSSSSAARRGLGVAPVAEEHRTPAEADLADLALGQHLVGLGVADLHLHRRRRHADASVCASSAPGRSVVPRPTVSVHAVTEPVPPRGGDALLRSAQQLRRPHRARRRPRCAPTTCRTARGRGGRGSARAASARGPRWSPRAAGSARGGSSPPTCPGGANTIVWPITSLATSWQLSPAMWNIGAAERSRRRRGGRRHREPCSASVIAAAAPLSIDASRKWMLLRCDSITPLGRPVVPLVKRMTNGSSSSSSTLGERRVAARTPPARRSRPRTTSTGRSAGSSTPSSRSSRRRSPSSTLGSVSSSAYAISSPVHQPLSPTVTAPSATRRPERQRVLDRVGRDDRDAVARSDAVLVAQRGRDRGDRLEDRGERVLAVGEDHVGLVAHALGRARAAVG